MTRLILLGCLIGTAAGTTAWGENWYERSFWLLHEDHHTVGQAEVGRDADLEETSRLAALCKPDAIQIHAKGNPGWTTYPSKIGYTPPKLVRDVLGVWRDVARRDGYYFSAYYNIGRDGEIMNRRPQWNRLRADGKLYERALCYHSGVAEEYLWPMIREIVERYRPDGFWLDGSCFTVSVCYCDVCQKRFQKEQGLPAPRGPGQRGWGQYKEMQRRIYREFIHKTAEFVHSLDPKCLVAFNWAYSVRMPEKPDSGVAYLTGDTDLNRLSIEAHWYDSLDLPFDLMTPISAVPAPDLAYDERLKSPEQIRQEIAVIVANGGRYFAWDAPTPTSGLSRARFQFMADAVAPFLRERRPWCLGSKRVADVSLLHSAAAHYALNQSAVTCFPRNNNRLEGAAETLRKLHLNYETVPDWRLEAQDIRGPLLIVEHPVRLAPATTKALIAYVRNGGRLLLTGMAILDSKDLQELAGVADCVAPNGTEPLVAVLDGRTVAFKRCLHRSELSTAKKLLAVRDQRGGSHPLLTRNDSGKGQAYYFACPLLTAPDEGDVPPGLLNWVFEQTLPAQERLLATDAPDTVEVVLRRQGRRCVIHLVNLASGKKEEVLGGQLRWPRITDIPPAAPCRVSLRLPTKPQTVRLQPQGLTLENWTYRQGWLTVNVPEFAADQLVVIEP